MHWNAGIINSCCLFFKRNVFKDPLERRFYFCQKWIILITMAAIVMTSSVDDIELEGQRSDRSDPQDFVDGRAILPAAVPIHRTDCSFNCSATGPRRPVCGTDGLTYPSRCHLWRTKTCEGRRVEPTSTLRCRSRRDISSSMGNCAQRRQQALLEADVTSSESASSALYIPQCLENGRFAPVQCHNSTAYCWCVTEDGRPISGSASNNAVPTCKGKRRTDNAPKRRETRRGAGSKAKCTSADRAKFNANLIKLFSEEYARAPRSTTSPRSSGAASSIESETRRIVDWKFAELDSNKDGILPLKELQSFRHMVKKLVEPRSCARTFHTNCDTNRNKKITGAEWSSCLDGASSGNKDHGGSSTSKKVTDPSKPFLPLRSMLEEKPKTNNLDDEQRESISSKHGSCMEERAKAQKKDRLDPDGHIFIPECADNVQYKREQCHKTTGYCWCVEEKSGKPIPATSTQHTMPNCSDVKIREIKGCPYSKRRQFLVDLLDDMSTEMVEYINNVSAIGFTASEANADQKLEERAVRWKLKMLDTNKNAKLERKEWKQYRMKILRDKALRKCSRNFLRYCDENDDQTITLPEWLNCTGVNGQQKMSTVSNKRKGPNPFDHYLKGR